MVAARGHGRMPAMIQGRRRDLTTADVTPGARPDLTLPACGGAPSAGREGELLRGLGGASAESMAGGG